MSEPETDTDEVKSFREMMGPYKRWYQFGWRSPEVLYLRLRSRFRPVFWIRTWYQRCRYGISDSDIWGLDFFLAKVTVRGAQKLREWNTGHPTELTAEEWREILTQIESGFQSWLDHQGWFHDHPEEEAKFFKAMDLYKEWFGGLWD